MTVYANGLEVSCKAQGDKVIAAFPDVCFTPPENPATPPGVPVPYPSFGFDSDTDKGTGTVKIGGKTITQKNLSYYTKTTGTEAGCAAKKGIITSKNTGKEYAAAWSSNVKADGEPVARMSDMATLNHASPMGNSTGGKVGGTNPLPDIDTLKEEDCPPPCRGLLNQLRLHEDKLDRYRKDPHSMDNKGFLGQSEERDKKIITSRIANLEKQIRNFKAQLEECIKTHGS